MIAFAASFLGTRFGRWAVIAALALAMAWLAWRYAVATGEKRAAIQRALDNAAAIKDRIRTDVEIRNMPRNARRAELRKWVRD